MDKLKKNFNHEEPTIEQEMDTLIEQAETYESEGDVDGAICKYQEMFYWTRSHHALSSWKGNTKVAHCKAKVGIFLAQREDYTEAYSMFDQAIALVYVNSTETDKIITKWMVLACLCSVLDGQTKEQLEKEIWTYGGGGYTLSFISGNPYYDLISGIVNTYYSDDVYGFTEVCKSNHDILDPIMTTLLLRLKQKIPEKEDLSTRELSVENNLDTTNHTIRGLCKLIEDLEAENRSLRKQLEKKDNTDYEDFGILG